MLAEQVAKIEHDLAVALAEIETLKASNAALDALNDSLNQALAITQERVGDMQQYIDETREMADTLAQSALNMLRASRREVIGYTPSAKPSAQPASAEQGDGLDVQGWPTPANAPSVAPGDMAPLQMSSLDGPLIVEHTDDGLPIFLQRDAPFKTSPVPA